GGRCRGWGGKGGGVGLKGGEGGAIPDGNTAAALDRLADAVREGVTARQRRAEDFRGALFGWRAWCAGHAWLDSVTRLEADALRQREETEAACGAWDRAWARVEDCLRECLARVRAILRAYDALLTSA